MTNNNPIAFNPDTMTVSQLKECAETLRTMFTSVERGHNPAYIGLFAMQAREDMLKKWGAK